MKKDMIDLLIENVDGTVLMTTLTCGLILMLALLFFGSELINYMFKNLEN